MAWISGCIGLLFVTPKTETPVFNADAVTTVRGLAGMWRALGSVVSAVSATREAPSSESRCNTEQTGCSGHWCTEPGPVPSP